MGCWNGFAHGFAVGLGTEKVSNLLSVIVGELLHCSHHRTISLISKKRQKGGGRGKGDGEVAVSYYDYFLDLIDGINSDKIGKIKITVIKFYFKKM